MANDPADEHRRMVQHPNNTAEIPGVRVQKKRWGKGRAKSGRERALLRLHLRRDALQLGQPDQTSSSSRGKRKRVRPHPAVGASRRKRHKVQNSLPGSVRGLHILLKVLQRAAGGGFRSDSLRHRAQRRCGADHSSTRRNLQQ